MIDINDYLGVFPEAKANEFFCEAELNEILLDSMHNIWSRKADVQGFYCENIIKK